VVRWSGKNRWPFRAIRNLKPQRQVDGCPPAEARGRDTSGGRLLAWPTAQRAVRPQAGR
jgi:hypothetical protein